MSEEQRPAQTSLPVLDRADAEWHAARSERALSPWQSAKVPTKRLNWRHEELMAWMILYPEMTQKQLAAKFNYSESWVSLVINSDMFRARLNAVRAEYNGPAFANVREKLTAVGHMALDRLMDEMSGEKEHPAGFYLEAVDRIMRHYLPSGAKAPATNNTQVNVVVASPEELAEARAVLRRAKEQTAPINSEPDDTPRLAPMSMGREF